MKIINTWNEPLFLLGLLFVMCLTTFLTGIAGVPIFCVDILLVYVLSPTMFLSTLIWKLRDRKDGREKIVWFLVADIVLWCVNFYLLDKLL